MSDRLKASFLNHVRSLFNIDGWLLPELTEEQQQKFVREPVRYFIGADKPQSDAIWREVLKRQRKEEVTLEFIDKSARAAIKALRELEQTAIMLEKWAPEIFPEVNEQDQKHFGRVMMESAAEAIRDAWAQAIKDMEPAKGLTITKDECLRYAQLEAEGGDAEIGAGPIARDPTDGTCG